MHKPLNPSPANLFTLSIFIAPFIVLPSLSEFADLPQGAWLQVSCFAIFLYWLASLHKSPPPTFRYHPAMLPLALFIVWCFSSLIWAVNPYELIHRLISYTAAAVAFTAAINFFSSIEQIRKLILFIFISGVAVALIGICQHLMGFSLIPQIAPPSATFANKNLASQFMVLTTPIALYFFFSKRKNWHYFLVTSSVAIMAGFLSYTMNRASWVAFIAESTFFYYFFLRPDKTKRHFKLCNIQIYSLAFGILLFTLILTLGNNSVSDRISQSKSYIETPSQQPRFAYWLNSLPMIKDHFITGTGLGNFKIVYPLYHRAILKDPTFTEHIHTADVHNDYLQLFVELGLVGAILFTWFLSYLIRQCRQIKNLPPEKILLSSSLTTALVGLATIACFSFPLSCGIQPFLGATYAGLLFVCSGSVSPQVLTPSRKHLSILLTVAVLLFSFKHNYQAVSADSNIGKYSDIIKNLPKAKKTVQTFPLRTKLLFFLAKSYASHGNHEMASKVYKTMLKTYPYDVNTMVNLGASLLDLSRLDEAQLYLQKALDIYPEHWAGHNNLGSLMMAKSDYLSAQKEFSLASNSKNNNALVWFNLGQAAAMNNDIPTAETAYARSKEIDPVYFANREDSMVKKVLIKDLPDY